VRTKEVPCSSAGLDGPDAQELAKALWGKKIRKEKGKEKESREEEWATNWCACGSRSRFYHTSCVSRFWASLQVV
jgi:hypothetical protein